ncbi:MAG TPA: class I SAM-dependent methyltransferase [Dehalococcoidia bacterium]
MQADGGWADSARAWIDLIDKDPNRTLLLDPVMLRLCADVRGKRVLDVGCGEGRFCRMLAERGASVVGIDPTALLVAEANERCDAGHYVRAIAENEPFADASFDLVITYVTLVDIPGYRQAIAEMARVLRPGGTLLAANLGFVTATPAAPAESPWMRDAEGNRLFYRIDRYAEEWPATISWAGVTIHNWHRPLSAYMDAYLSSGLILREFLEPVPEDDSLRDQQAFEDWFRVPLFNVMRWEKAI